MNGVAATLANVLALAAAASLAAGWPAAIAQVANAQGPCSVAINASGQAVVTVNASCDAKMAAQIQRTTDKLIDVERANRKQDDRLARLEADREAQARQVKELAAAVQTVTQAATVPTATPADKRAAALLEQGDATGAIALLGREALDAAQGASRAAERSAKLYRQQAALLRTKDVGLALGAVELALAQQPDDFNTLWNAGDLAKIAGSTEKAGAYYQRMRAAAMAALENAPTSTTRQRDLSFSHVMIGEVQQAQDNLQSALTNYQASIAIGQTLAAADPGNTEWQRDL